MAHTAFLGLWAWDTRSDLPDCCIPSVPSTATSKGQALGADETPKRTEVELWPCTCAKSGTTPRPLLSQPLEESLQPNDCFSISLSACRSSLSPSIGRILPALRCCLHSLWLQQLLCKAAGLTTALVSNVPRPKHLGRGPSAAPATCAGSSLSHLLPLWALQAVDAI